MIRVLTLTGLLAALLCAGPLAAQTAWTPVPDESSIKWTTAWKSTTVRGGFERFHADIRFDPDAPAKGAIRVEVDTTSIYLEGQDAQATLTGPDWFAAAEWPRAVFESKSLRKTGAERYAADGALTIRGRTENVTLPFTLRIENGVAKANGSLELNRRAFNIGGGMFDDAVTDSVTVTVTLTARKQ